VAQASSLCLSLRLPEETYLIGKSLRKYTLSLGAVKKIILYLLKNVQLLWKRYVIGMTVNGPFAPLS
jgi:hypothetical protein